MEINKNFVILFVIILAFIILIGFFFGGVFKSSSKDKSAKVNDSGSNPTKSDTSNKYTTDTEIFNKTNDESPTKITDEIFTKNNSDTAIQQKNNDEYFQENDASTDSLPNNDPLPHIQHDEFENQIDIGQFSKSSIPSTNQVNNFSPPNDDLTQDGFYNELVNNDELINKKGDQDSNIISSSDNIELLDSNNFVNEDLPEENIPDKEQIISDLSNSLKIIIYGDKSKILEILTELCFKNKRADFEDKEQLKLKLDETIDNLQIKMSEDVKSCLEYLFGEKVPEKFNETFISDKERIYSRGITQRFKSVIEGSNSKFDGKILERLEKEYRYGFDPVKNSAFEIIAVKFAYLILNKN